MGFTWTTISQGSKINAAHLNEIKNNIDSVLTDLGTSWSWTNFPVAADGKIENADASELRAAIDYADDNNYCSAYDSSKLISVDSNEHGTYRGTDYSGYLSGYWSSHRDAVYSGYCGINNSSYIPV